MHEIELTLERTPPLLAKKCCLPLPSHSAFLILIPPPHKLYEIADKWAPQFMINHELPSTSRGAVALDKRATAFRNLSATFAKPLNAAAGKSRFVADVLLIKCNTNCLDQTCLSVFN